MTKGLIRSQHEYLVSKLGLLNVLVLEHVLCTCIPYNFKLHKHTQSNVNMCAPNIVHFHSSKSKYAKDFMDQLFLSEYEFYYNISFSEIHIILKEVKWC